MNGALAWFARNTVAANLLMVLIIVGGLTSLPKLRKEVMPEISSDLITVTVPYPGAAPAEVEQGVCSRIEEQVQDLEAVKRLRSVAREGSCTVSIELLGDADLRQALDDVKARVDAIDTFPDEAEKPVVQELIVRRQVLSVAVSGPLDEASLKRLGEQVRDAINDLPGITQVTLAAARPYEISIEVSEDALRRHGLSFDRVAQAVRRSSLDLPGGTVKTRGGEILLRTEGQAYTGTEFERLVLLTRADGTRLTLGDVATVVDGFADVEQAARFDGQPAVLVQVFRVGDQDVTAIAREVKDYVAAANQRLPAGVELTIWQDDSRYLRSRLDVLMRNGRAGLVLVLLVLALTLRLRLAGWVAMGIVVSFMGALWLMPALDQSINLISLFAFIVVLGIVVDDAIVVGENIYRHHEMGKEGLEAAVDGVREVAVPVAFSILTTIAAFAPLTLVAGNTGKLMKLIPLIVISTLVFSMIDSLFILPAHLSHLKRRRRPPRAGLRAAWRRFQDRMAAGFTWVIERWYRPSLDLALRWRQVSLAVALAVLLLTVGFVAGGHLEFSFFPPLEADSLVAFLTMPQGTPASETARALERIEAGVEGLRQEVTAAGEPGAIQHVLTSIGEQPYRTRQRSPAMGPGESIAAANVGEVHVELAPSENRVAAAGDLLRRWRELTGPVPDALELTFNASLFSTGEPINIQLAGPRIDELKAAAERLKEALRQYPGVLDIADSFRAGKEELKLEITPEGEALGLTLADLARQVRQGFYGEEAQRVQRGREELKVMVRYTAAERSSLGGLERMRIRTPDGAEVPFSVVGRVRPGRGFAAIERTDRKRTINVTADVDLSKANSNKILQDVRARVLPRILADYHGLTYSLEGEQQQQRETLGDLARGFVLALVIIYALLAIPFRSYLQPAIVMSAIPFGIIGAIWGHVLMGMTLTIMSGFGIVALTGVVVNDSLVLVDFVNRRRRAGDSVGKAVREAGEKRFRPIILTSLTTFAGLTPLLLEKSLQAQFLIPMAISLGFGVLFATAISLILVPVGYVLLDDLIRGTRRLFRRPQAPPELAPEA